jgi:hypothetical protein
MALSGPGVGSAPFCERGEDKVCIGEYEGDGVDAVASVECSEPVRTATGWRVAWVLGVHPARLAALRPETSSSHSSLVTALRPRSCRD